MNGCNFYHTNKIQYKKCKQCRLIVKLVEHNESGFRLQKVKEIIFYTEEFSNSLRTKPGEIKNISEILLL